VWDLESGKLKHTLEGRAGTVLSVAVTPDGTQIISGSFDKIVR
jgi:WD40 repeat protein